MHFFNNFHQYHSVLTNGETELEIQCSRYSCGIDPGSHIFAQDGYGNMYLDGKLAYIEIKEKDK